MNQMLCTRAPLSGTDDYVANDATVPALLEKGITRCVYYIHATTYILVSALRNLVINSTQFGTKIFTVLVCVV